MKNVIRSKFPLSAGTCLMLVACQAQPLAPPVNQPPPAANDAALRPTTLHRGSNCGTERASLSPVADAASLARIVLGGGLIGAETRSTAVDFARQSVFRLSMGQQPTAGASLGVVGVDVGPETHRMTVNALWQPPDPGRMQATVVMRPCVIFAVPRGDYRAVRVVDAKQQERLAVELSAATAPR